MDFFEAVNDRVSIRVYKKEPVPLEKVSKIIQAARKAPSWSNKQCWRFLVVDSHVKKSVIGSASGQENIAKACKDAPYVIVQCADPEKSGVNHGLPYFLYDCGLAMENLVLAAQAEGLSACIVGFFDAQAVRGVLNIPPEIQVVAFTPLGYADEVALPRSRKKTNEVVFHNTWGNQYE